MPRAACGEANVWGKRSDWVDYSGTLDGEKVGIVMMDHPGNPRHPTYWHSRAYGLHSINPFGVHDFLNDKAQDGSLTLQPGEHVRFRYRVVVHPGAVRGRLAELYKQYRADGSASIARTVGSALGLVCEGEIMSKVGRRHFLMSSMALPAVLNTRVQLNANNRVRVGIVGFNGRGGAHLQAYRRSRTSRSPRCATSTRP